jgi:two-component system, sensor histidine kinase YesM
VSECEERNACMKNITMSKAFSFIFITLVLIPTVLMFLIINNNYSNILMDREIKDLDQKINTIGEKLQKEIENAVYLGASISVSDKSIVLEKISNYLQSQNSAEKYDLSNEINRIINYFITNSKNNIISIDFYNNNRECYEFKSGYGESEETLNDRWYETTIKYGGKPYILNPNIDTKNKLSKYISIALKVIEKNNFGIEVIRIRIKTEIFDDLYRIYGENQGSQFMIFNQNEILYNYSDDDLAEIVLKEKLTNQITKCHIGNELKYILSTSIPRASWEVVSVVDYYKVTAPVRKMSINYFMLMFAFLVFFAIFNYIFFKKILRPIQKLVKHMSYAQKGNFEPLTYTEGPIEISSLINSFNTMIEEIYLLLLENEKQHKEITKTEIRILQSQIKPHFIVNTLNAIKMMAVINKQTGIVNMADAFMNYLDISINRVGDYITIEQELKGIESYVYIMKIRYGDNFEYMVDLDDDLKNYSILSLLLQPIVENSIVHGLVHLKEGGKIQIDGFLDKNDIIHLTVSDNGVGIESHELSRLQTICSDGQEHMNIGLFNVDRRIKLRYGAGYGIHITSNFNEGTKIEITFPVKETVSFRGCQEDDKNINC